MDAGRWRSAALPVAVLGSAILFWRGPFDLFGLPKFLVVALSAAVAVVTSAVLVVRRGAVVIPIGPFPIAILAFLVAAAVATVTSVDPAVSFFGQYYRWSGLLGYVIYAVLGLVAIRHASAWPVRRLVDAVLAGAAVTAAYALLQSVGLDPFAWAGGIGNTSVAGNINWGSAYVGLGLTVALHRAVSPGSLLMRRVSAGLVVVLGAGLISLEAFQGFLVAAVGTAIVLVVQLWDRLPAARDLLRRRRRELTALLVLVLAVGIWSAFQGPEVLRRAVGVGFEARLHFWDAALSMIADRPLLGSGLDTFGHLWSRYQPPAYAVDFGDAWVDVPHSVPLGMFVDGGVLLGVAYLAVIGSVGLAIARGASDDGVRIRGDLLSLVLIWVGYQTQSLVSIDQPQLAVLHFVVAGSLVGALGQVSEKPVSLPWIRQRVERKRGADQLGPVRPLGRAVVPATVVLVVAAAVTLSPQIRADLAAGRGLRLALQAESTGDEPTYSRAWAAFREAHRLAPEALYYEREARFRFEKGDDQRGIVALQRAAELAPHRPQFAVDLAERLAEIGRSDDAARWWRTVAVTSPNDPRHLLRAATFLRAEGQDDRADQLVQRARAIAPDFVADLSDG